MTRDAQTVTLMNMCMLSDDQGNVLVLDRVRTKWRGIAFPGGHVEPGESLEAAMVREVLEETGLTVLSPRLVGVKDWITEDGRAVVFLYRANAYTGALTSSDEGRVFWTPLDTLRVLSLAPDLSRDLEVFLREELSEHFFQCLPDGSWSDELF